MVTQKIPGSDYSDESLLGTKLGIGTAASRSTYTLDRSST